MGHLEEAVVKGQVHFISDVLGTHKKYQACHQHWKSAKENKTTRFKKYTPLDSLLFELLDRNVGKKLGFNAQSTMTFDSYIRVKYLVAAAVLLMLLYVF